jgi:hypothetical protein
MKNRTPDDLALFFPCANCQRSYLDHLNGKCLFGPGEWAIIDLEKITPTQWHTGFTDVTREQQEHKNRQTQLRRDEEALDKLEKAVRALCQHVDRYGKNAIEAGFMMDECPFCGWNDY